MALPSRISPEHSASWQAGREILIWTTRDGREIPLDEMSDEHVANAVRVLSMWRSRLKRRGGDEAVVCDLKDAIDRFRTLQRRRRKAEPKDEVAAPHRALKSKSALALPKPVRSKPKPERAKAKGAGAQSSLPSNSTSAPRSRWARPRKPVAKT